MLLPEQVLPLLNHAEADVRFRAGKYFSDLADASPPQTAGELWRAIDSFGERRGLFGALEAAGMLRTLACVPQNDASVNRALDMLAKSPTDENVIANLSNYFLKVSVDILIAHRDQILPLVDLQTKSAMKHRLAIHSMTADELWQQLLDLGTKSETAEDSSRVDSSAASRIVDALAGHPETAIVRATEVLREPDDRYWLETWCIDLLGQLRHNASVDLMVDAMMTDDGDFKHVSAGDALARMDPNHVIPKLEAAYDPSDPDGVYDRMRIPESLGRMKHPLAEAALLRLLAVENNSEALSMVCTALIDLCTTDGLEALRKVVAEDRYDHQMADLMEEFVALAKMTDYHPPELPQWTKTVANKMRDREEREAKLLKITGSKNSAELLQKMVAVLSGKDESDSHAPEPTPFRTETTVTYRRETEKIGRNDPCPCGSGKKYKKCCGK